MKTVEVSDPQRYLRRIMVVNWAIVVNWERNWKYSVWTPRDQKQNND